VPLYAIRLMRTRADGYLQLPPSLAAKSGGHALLAAMRSLKVTAAIVKRASEHFGGSPY
jgi:hypothetical protein